MPDLPETERARLEAAYRATTYRIHTAGDDIDLRLGEASPALAALLREAGAERWAIVTAWNPASLVQAEATNSAAQARLQQWLSARGYRWQAGENRADAADWPPEPTCLVPGMSEAEARQCGAAFGQNAVVCGDGESVPRLVWCR